MPVQIVQKVCSGTGFPHIAVFHKSGGSPLNSFDILTVFLSMWVPHATGVFQTRTNEGEIGLTFNTFWTGIKITSDETKGPVSLPYHILYMKAPIQIGRQFNSQIRKEPHSICTDG